MIPVENHYDEMFNYLTNISIKNKYIHLDNPKTGSTSLKKLLTSIEVGAFEYLYSQNYHPSPLQSPFVKPFQLDWEYFNQLTEEFFVFSCVRNPYARILSAYLANIKNNTKQRARVLNDLCLPEDADITLEQFLEYISNLESDKFDHHWQKQSVLLSIGKIKIDRLIHFESLESEAVELLRELLPEETIPELDSLGVITNSQDHLNEYFNNGLEEMVYEIYKDDFKSFAYERIQF